MKSLIVTQKEEIERAVVGMGEYRLAHTFKNLIVDTRKYFQMTEQQREKVLKQVFSATFEDQKRKCVSDEMEANDTGTISKADEENPLCQLSIPHYVAEKVWKEGKELASQDSSVCASPGCTDGSAWLVKSDCSTHQRPFFVECKKSGQLCCEKTCMMFNSCGVCAHIVAIATRRKCFDILVNWLSKRGSMNVTKMAHSGLPKGAGKKARSHRKFSTKFSTRNVKKILQDADDESYTPRPGVTTKPTGSLHSLPSPNFSETEIHSYHTSDPTSYSVPAQQLHPPAPPFTPPMALPPAPSPLFPNLQACVDATRSVCGSTSVFTAAAHECLYPQQSPRPSSLLPPPPPLIRAPVQLSMPFMYAPMYLPCSTQQTQERQEAGQEKDSTSIPFLLVFVKGNISRCAGCGKKNLRDGNGKVHPPPHDICLMHKEFITFENPNTGIRQKSQERRNVYYHACKKCVVQKCDQPKVVVQPDIRVKLPSVHMHHIMEEFGLQILNNVE